MTCHSTPQASNYTSKEIVHIARHVTWVGFWVNAALGALKISAGVLGRSSAMVADGVHSLSDFATDILVIVMVGISRRGADRDYQYGHGKYETFAVLLISVALLVVSCGILVDGIDHIVKSLKGEVIPRPGMVALVMAVVSIAAKELLFHYTRRWGRRIGSASVVANAWHHRSDSLSSIATLLGIAGAMFLGERWRVLDPLAAILVSIFIGIMSVRLAIPAIRELLEAALPPELTAKIYEVIRTTPGVITFHHFRSRRNGSSIIVDLHIKVAPGITVVEGHDIASDLESRLRSRLGQDMITNIHVEPYGGETIDKDGACR